MQGYLTGQREFSPWMWEPRPDEGNDGDDDDDDFEEERVEDERPSQGEREPTMDFEALDEEEERPAPEGIPEPVASNVDGFWNSERFRYALQRATMAACKADNR
jgi:hypothetical protein